MKRIALYGVTITDKKEGPLNRGDISFVAARFRSGSSYVDYLGEEAFLKVRAADLNYHFLVGIDITHPLRPLGPGEQLALLLYEADAHTKKNKKSWNFFGSNEMSYYSKEDEYGHQIFSYDDFIGNPVISQQFTGASIEIWSYDM